jgi:hypothetical protein
MLKEISQGRERRLDLIVDSQTKYSENNNGKKTIFLTAGGYFQEKYIALFEELTNTIPTDEGSEVNEYDNARFIADVFFEELVKEYKGKKFNFNKIFCVTIPSQIIAKFLYERIEKEYYENNEMKFYSNMGGKENHKRELPLLIRLSSYYSFDEEINFQNIKAGDRVLIINDVISTGNLITNIINSISNKVVDKNNPNLKARIEKILSVVDTRVSEDEIQVLLSKNLTLNKDDICSSAFFQANPFLSENDIISLRKRDIVKYKNRPEHLKEAKLIRINPILNAPVTFPTRHSEEDKIAFKNPVEFLEQFPSQDLKIGHFHQNSLHHPYFIKPNDLFKKDDLTGITNENGIKLFQSVISRVYSLEHSVDINYYLESLTHQLEALKQQSHLFNSTNKKTVTQFDIAATEINKIKDFVELDKTHNLNPIKNKLKVDYVFRPVFSGIELLSRNDITEFCDVATHNIIELHRFDTIKGWRFIIPPKYLNDSLVNKTALIIDMGSFTGDSIIQMVDALSVYQLNKIIVVSLVGRIEDFDREFLSRMREIKVKRRKNGESNLPDNTVANINIYFGTNIHIPPYPSIKVCKFCNEKDKIETYLIAKECTSAYVINNIEDRRKQLELFHVNEIDKQCPSYFPEIRVQVNEKYDTLVFYRTRDDLGKIDGYRFYENYYEYFDKLIEGSENYNRDMEAIIAVCLHENHLLTTIKNQLPDIYSNLQKFIKEVIVGNTADTLHYSWQKKELLRFHLAINDSELLSSDLITILDFTNNCEACQNLLLFFIWEKHFEYRKETNKRFSVYEFRDNVFDVKNKIGIKHEELLKEIFNICDEFEYNAFSEIDLSFYKLKLFFKSEASYNNRSNYVSSGLTTHPSIYNAVNRLKTPLNRSESDPKNYKEDIKEFTQNWNQKKERLQHELIMPLNKIKEIIKNSDTHANIEFMYVPESSANINYLIRSIDSELAKFNDENLVDGIKSIKSSIDTIMKTYLMARSEFATFFDKFLTFNPVTELNLYFESEDFKGLRIPESNLSINLETETLINSYLVNIHPLLLSCVYKEIFENYNSYSDGSIFSVTDSIQDNTFILRFEQNSKVKDPQKLKSNNNHKVCFLNLENNLLSTFGVTFYSNKADFYNPKLENPPTNFIQEIKIPIFKSFKNDSI